MFNVGRKLTGVEWEQLKEWRRSGGGTKRGWRHGQENEGMKFWAYNPGCRDGEWWVTPEKFDSMAQAHTLRKRKYRSADPQKTKEKDQAYNKAYYARDPEADKKRVSAYRAANRAKVAARERAYREKNRERIKSQQQARTTHPEAKQARCATLRDRLAKDPLFALTSRLRSRTCSAFRLAGFHKTGKTAELLGCDWETAKAHIESQFVDCMSWENRSLWHIDHIMPLASAKTEEELVALCHYTNLQPLWAEDNLRKHDKILDAPPTSC